jgi:hypothetical protein
MNDLAVRSGFAQIGKREFSMIPRISILPSALLLVGLCSVAQWRISCPLKPSKPADPALKAD